MLYATIMKMGEKGATKLMTRQNLVKKYMVSDYNSPKMVFNFHKCLRIQPFTCIENSL